MTEQPPQEPKKKSKGLPTWVWFVGTFAIVSLLGNVVFGGNTWITTGMNFINSTIASLQVEKDTSKDPFCLTGSISAIDKENATAVINEADALIGTTTGAIGYASMTEDEAEKTSAIVTIQESATTYKALGERILTAKSCDDATFAFLMEDFGNTLVDMGENFNQWSLQALSEKPELLSSVPTLIETAVIKAQALIKFVETLE
ncbi:MAG: hypothetical protein F2614_03910 [Actinobacteria bacterium]|uniref:Unannotated protein n=1 Tax=freshwater metagenome TaxID=449393 RepID=A0A6J6JMA2_9ZZZZ|nr:hypothetical protein [Actinomycetota bacterium]